MKTFIRKYILIICNIVLSLILILSLLVYSRTTLEQKKEMKLNNFCASVESMKQVSENYIYMEKGYVNNWAAYIESQHMTADQALDFIRTINTNKNRSAHLVDMEDKSARSTVVHNGISWVHCYDSMLEDDTAANNAFLDKMDNMFQADSDEIQILGKYLVEEEQQTVVSVGSRVTIREEDGSDKDYLLLRLIPVEVLQDTWVFPTEFVSAEISIINTDGGYIVQSPSLRSKDFPEFIRSYNFQDSDNESDNLEEQLSTTDSGLMKYKNSAGKECYFYYSKLEMNTDAFVLGYIPVADIQSDLADWGIILRICGTFMILVLIDGWHFLSVNRRLRAAVGTAEKANMAKTQFLSSMSHDIRTPMNAVIGMTELATKHLDDPASAKDRLDKISMSGNHLLTLINDILDISKVESGKMTLSPCVFSLHELVNEIQVMISQNAEDKNISVAMRMHNTTYDSLIGDPLRLRQVLINILTNSVKYTEPNGHVIFDITESNISEDGEHVELKFIIKDDGIGMSEEFQKTMYSSFARATDSRINMIQGSGLGLTIVKEMVELMNGTIECSSELGKGTTFTVRLQMEISHEPVPGLTSYDQMGNVKTGDFKDTRVLIAEDNDLNWTIIQTFLEEHGIAADRAENGQVCLDILNDPQSPKYTLVLMDVQMPVMDGKTATRKIRSSDNSYVRNIPVVAMTADAFAEDIYACLEAGMDEHIAKPIHIAQVLQALRMAKAGTLHRKEDV